MVEYSFVECEDLNTLGRFSFNKFNKEVEVNMEGVCYFYHHNGLSFIAIIKVALKD